MDNKNTANPNQLMLLDLCEYSQLLAKPIFTVKMRGNKPSYEALDQFRQHIEVERLGTHRLPYSATKKKIFTYKSIFLLLGLVFVFLGGVIFTQSAAWHIAESYILAAKGMIGTFCGIAGLSALWIAKSLRTEKEAANHSLRQARYKLTKAYARKKMEFGLKGLFAFGKSYDKAQVLKHAYRDAQDKFHEHVHNLEHLCDRISRAPLPVPEREHLYNQALLEFIDHLDQTLETFMKVKAST